MADSKRRILLIALGTTPHLLTFTLAALYKESPEAMPTEIRIVTTELGAEMARRSFFGEGNILDAFWRDYGLSPAAFTEADIHAISSADGEPIADIRTLDDSNRAADLIVKLVRECCEDPDASLHVSIVGGRKSMGMLMGSALTFYGRDRDRISHTLSENETAPDRRPYPSPEELAANPDVVILADLPFLRLRQILPAMMLSKEYSFSEIVRNSQQAIEYMPRVRLTHDGSRWRLYADGVPVYQTGADELVYPDSSRHIEVDIPSGTKTLKLECRNYWYAMTGSQLSTGDDRNYGSNDAMWGDAKLIFGSGSMFKVPSAPWPFHSLPYFILLGILCAFVGVYIIQLNYHFGNRLKKAFPNRWVRLGIGCAGLAGLLWLFPILAGDGYNFVQMLFSGADKNHLQSWNHGCNLLLLSLAAVLLKVVGTVFTLECGGEIFRVPLYEIRYLDVEKNYTTVHAKRDYTVKKTLGALSDELDERFFRIGRAAIVNLSYIRRVTKTDAILSDGAAVPLPRGAYEALNRAIIAYH